MSPTDGMPMMMPVTADDVRLRALLDAAGEGDGRALDTLVRETQAYVWRVCTALGSLGEEADLVQETYLRAMRSMATYRGDAPVTVWLASIARCVCADDVRRRQRRRRLMDRLIATEPRTPAVAEMHDAGDMSDMVATLDPDRREAFLLTQLVGLSYEEAAAVCGCPIGTIRSRVARARSDLAELVAVAHAV